MKVMILIACFLISACSSINDYDVHSDGLHLKKGPVEGAILTVSLVNNTKNKQFYEHWFGQEGSPVAYCQDVEHEIYICSTKVFLIHDEFYTHETVIEPNETVVFTASIRGAVKIGIKSYQFSEDDMEKYIWLDL